MGLMSCSLSAGDGPCGAIELAHCRVKSSKVAGKFWVIEPTQRLRRDIQGLPQIILYNTTPQAVDQVVESINIRWMDTASVHGA